MEFLRIQVFVDQCNFEFYIFNGVIDGDVYLLLCGAVAALSDIATDEHFDFHLDSVLILLLVIIRWSRALSKFISSADFIQVFNQTKLIKAIIQTKQKRTIKMQPQIQLQTSVFIWGFLVKQKHQSIPTIVKQLQGKHIIKVTSGGFFYLALSANGQAYAWGSGKYNRFGIQGDMIDIPRQIPIKEKIVEMSAGNWHSMLLDANGHCYATGHNKYGSCGIGTFENNDLYTKCLIDGKVKMVACGDGFSLILSEDGDIYSCGHHELHGHKTKENINKFKLLKIQGQKFRHISAGFTHSVCTTTEGAVYSWGDSTFYQLGHGTKSHQQQPKRIQKLHSNEIKILNASCSRGQKNGHSMAISESGKVYTWGSGYKGKLGHAEEWSHADSADEPYPKLIKNLDVEGVKTGGGGIHATLIGADGGIYSFGCGSDGRLGHKESDDHRYLYREGYPRKIQTLQDWHALDLFSSYYQNICVAVRKVNKK